MWILLFFFVGAYGIAPCPGDTRGDQRCNHDPTHRVCALIGMPQTSFWTFTGQRSWCGTVGHYGGPYGHLPRCPTGQPTWCICKWALARWIEGQGCDSVTIDCGATDICNLKHSYVDYSVTLEEAHRCVEKKCPQQWHAC